MKDYHGKKESHKEKQEGYKDGPHSEKMKKTAKHMDAKKMLSESKSKHPSKGTKMGLPHKMGIKCNKV